MQRAKTVEAYLAAHPEWEELLAKLRKILVGTRLEECIKWGAPCYTYQGKNLVGIGAFKQHCALWFHQGVHLDDPEGVLVNAQEGKTKALRQWRFTSAKEVVIKTVKAYVQEAIAKQEAGVETRPTRGAAVEIPSELVAALKGRPKARAAFAALTPGRQREYCDHIASAKREATRLARTSKALPLIEAGVGLHDKYRNC